MLNYALIKVIYPVFTHIIPGDNHFSRMNFLFYFYTECNSFEIFSYISVDFRNMNKFISSTYQLLQGCWLPWPGRCLQECWVDLNQSQVRWTARHLDRWQRGRPAQGWLGDSQRRVPLPVVAQRKVPLPVVAQLQDRILVEGTRTGWNQYLWRHIWSLVNILIIKSGLRTQGLREGQICYCFLNKQM